MPALMYGFFACYAVTGKCELRTDTQGRDLAVFTSLEDCQRFGSGPAQQRPNSEGKWPQGDGHYFQCLSLTPTNVPAAATGSAAAAAAPSATAPPTAAAPTAATGAVPANSAAAAAPGAAVLAAAGAATATVAKPATATAPATAGPMAAAAAKPGAAAVPAKAEVSTAPAVAVPAAPAVSHSEASRPVYRTTAEALQHDFETNPEALNQKIGNAVVEVSGTVVDRRRVEEDGALQLSGRSSDVTAWLKNSEVSAALTLSKHAYVTLSCDRIGTLVAASARRPGIVEVRDCRVVSHGG